MDTVSLNAASVVALEAKIDALTAQVAWLVERQRWQSELLAELGPIGREILAASTGTLDDLERRGYFAVGRELLKMVDTVVEHYGPEDVRLLGDNLISLLDTVKAVTQPALLEVAQEASQTVNTPGHLEPLGIWGMLKESQDEDVRLGVALTLQVLRQVGRATRKRVGEAPAPTPTSRLASRLAPRLRAEAAPRPAASAPAPRPALAAAPRPNPAKAASPSMSPAAAPVGPADMCVVDPASWTREQAERDAVELGVAPLTAEHWAVIEWVRAEYTASGASPNVRRITRGSGVDTKELYRLFPPAPGRVVSRLAGIPKPGGCL